MDVNVYLPTDYGTPDSNNVFLECLGDLDGFISTQSFDNIIISGAFNVNFSRHNHNCNQLLDFMTHHNLVSVTHLPTLNSCIGKMTIQHRLGLIMSLL